MSHVNVFLTVLIVVYIVECHGQNRDFAAPEVPDPSTVVYVVQPPTLVPPSGVTGHVADDKRIEPEFPYPTVSSFVRIIA